MTADTDRLGRLLGEDDLAWVVARARRRLELGQPLRGAVTLRDASLAQRRAAGRLLGRRVGSGSALRVSLEAVDDVLRRSGADPDGLASAVARLTGPVTDRTVEKAARDRAWSRVHDVLDAAVAAHPRAADRGAELAAWAEGVRAGGLLRRLAGTPEAAEALVGDLASALRALPSDGEPLGVFARRTLGSSHALDHGRAVTTLLFGAARALARAPDISGGAAWRREVWARVGLLRDDLSSTVVALGLPGDPDTTAGRVLDAWAHVGQPAVLTLRQLVHDPPRPDLSGRVVSVCESPVVVSVAADRLGSAAGPLVCVEGQPGTAAMLLLRLLSDAGARLRYHGDFDWGGIRIGNILFDRLPFTPWRFDTAAYLAAATSERSTPLAGVPARARWDERLADAMTSMGCQVEEESVLDLLLEDLVAPAH